MYKVAHFVSIPSKRNIEINEIVHEEYFNIKTKDLLGFLKSRMTNEGIRETEKYKQYIIYTRHFIINTCAITDAYMIMKIT